MQVRTARASEQGSSDAPAHSRCSGKQGSTGYGLQAEAEAFRAGVQLIHTVTQGAVIIETDSLELVGLWNNEEIQRSEFTIMVFRDIQELSSSFSSFRVVHARRSANKAAHVCASFAEHSAFDVWANAPPSFLLQVLQDDCNHFDE